MTRDDIIRLGRESQREHFSDGGHWFSMEVRDLERFAALVAAAEQPKPEPVGVMQESYIMEGLVIPVVTQELPVGTPLYAAPPDTEALRRENERLRKDNEQFATLVGQYAAEQAPDALRMVVKDRDALQAENKRLREALQAALDGGCSYVHENEDDEIGRHGCCDALSYKSHEPYCWTLKAKAALRREETT